LREEAAEVAVESGIGTDHRNWPGNAVWAEARIE
jgi:hypothetical protein